MQSGQVAGGAGGKVAIRDKVEFKKKITVKEGFRGALQKKQSESSMHTANISTGARCETTQIFGLTVMKREELVTVQSRDVSAMVAQLNQTLSLFKARVLQLEQEKRALIDANFLQARRHEDQERSLHDRIKTQSAQIAKLQQLRADHGGN